MDNIQRSKQKNQGFTLIELIVVVGVFAILFTVSTISLTGLIPKANFVSTHQSLLSDIKNQQQRAMTGYTNGSGDGSAYGIYLENEQYTLFTGPAYNPEASDNYTIKISSGINIIDITFPSNSIIFLQNSGEVSGYGESISSFKISNSGEEKIIDINKLGVVLPN